MIDMIFEKAKACGRYLSNELSNPLNLVIVGVCLYLLYRILRSRSSSPSEPEEKKQRLPKMKKRDFTLAELAPYNGNDNERILIAIKGKVFDVSNRGRDFYGPGGPYEDLAGRDASRALATFSLSKSGIKDTHDDLSDLDSFQRESLDNWEAQFLEKYDVVGKLLKPGEMPTNYGDSNQEIGDAASKDD